jgi:phosphoglycerate dehydrogenase-like enzyme
LKTDCTWPDQFCKVVAADLPLDGDDVDAAADEQAAAGGNLAARLILRRLLGIVGIGRVGEVVAGHLQRRLLRLQCRASDIEYAHQGHKIQSLNQLPR